MVTVLAVKAAQHCKAGQLITVARWQVVATCPWQATAGRPGRSSLALCMECMVVLDGVWMATGSAVGCLLQMWVEVVKVCCSLNQQWHRIV